MNEVQVRGILPEKIVISTILDPYLPLKTLAAYSGMSKRFLQDRLTDPVHPLPHYRYSAKMILVRRSEFDAWAAAYRQVGRPDVDRIVDEMLRHAS